MTPWTIEAPVRQTHGYKEVERSIDWPKFHDNAIALLNSFGSRYYIKEYLRKAV